MILNFSFKNYLSFRDAQQFSFEPIFSKKEFGPVRVAAVYGANASGKSNFLDALSFVSYFVRTSYAAGDSQSHIPIDPFLLDSESRSSDTEFSIEFLASNLKYDFSFGINKNEVTYENLTVYRSKQPSLLYDRSSINGKQSIKFGSTFTGAKKQLWDITRDNSLFLSAAAAAGSEVIQPAFAVLANEIKLYDATHYLAELATIKKLFINNDVRAQMLSQLIKYADIGIDGMDVRQAEGVPGLKDSFIGLDDIPEEARKKIAEDFK
nr:AAA family ATPase [Collinsella sp. CM84Y_54]